MLRPIPVSLLLCLFALFVVPVRAQTSVYVVGGLANYGFTNISSETISSKGDTGGIGGGMFYNFPIQSRVTVGLDGRIAYTPGYKGGVLGGAALRVGFVPHRDPLRPFFQIGAGVVHSSYNQAYAISNGFETYTGTVNQSVTSGAAQFVVGLDIRLNDRFDLRAPELGAEAGAGNGVHATGSFFNVGLVYHLGSAHHS